jgi:phage shock protein PspC (stress-responsive transcriptional regulator)
VIGVEDPAWPPPRPDEVSSPLARAYGDDGAILGGVARDLGARTAVDPLWFRIAFVVLAVFSGFGVLLYCGAWLILRGRQRSPFGPLVIAGATVIVVGTVVLLGESGTSYVDSPWTLVFVLAGIAVALWQPRGVTPSGTAVGDTGGRVPPPIATRAPAASTARAPQPPSALGRWTLAAALLVGAAGAVSYQLSDDGLHPERWLGAAAIVCGIGITIGAWRGRALWLVVPGLLFAGAGFVAGHAARAGIDEFDAGSRDFWVGPMTPNGLPAREHLIAGEIEVTLYSAPAPGTRADLRVGLGEIDIVVDDSVTIDVRAHVHDGDVVVDGDDRPNDGDVQVIRIGSGTSPDAVIDATISVGRLEIDRRPLQQRARIPDGFLEED